VKRAIDENIRGTGITLAMHQGDHFGVKKLRSVCVSLAPDPRDKGPAKVARWPGPAPYFRGPKGGLRWGFLGGLLRGP
jgi:hypothetical protein